MNQPPDRNAYPAAFFPGSVQQRPSPVRAELLQRLEQMPDSKIAAVLAAARKAQAGNPLTKGA